METSDPDIAVCLGISGPVGVPGGKGEETSEKGRDPPYDL